MPALRPAHLRRLVLGSLRDGGPRTARELRAEHSLGRLSLRRELPTWSDRGYLERTAELGTGGPPAYRYTITPLGLAVLEADEL